MALDPNTNLLSPIGHAQLKDALNKIPVGGKITVYNANTQVLSKIYKVPDASSAWANPILIDSLGHANLEIWLPVNKAYDFILSDGNGNIIEEYFGISGINDPTQGGGIDVSQLGEWVLAGSVIDQSPGYVEIEGDWVDKITQFKRLKLVLTTERHGWVVNVNTIGPGQGTRIEYELDDDAPIVGRINSVYYGLISHVNTSFPNYLGGAVFIKKGVDIPANPIMEIWDTTGNFHYVHGSDTITSFGSTTKTWPGAVKWLYFRADATISPLDGKIITPNHEDMEVLSGDIVQVILDDDTGITYAFGLLKNTADLTQTQSIEKKQTVLSGDLDANGNPLLLRVPTLIRANSTMTSNSSPEGYLATASTVLAGSEPFQAFGGPAIWSSALNAQIGAWINLLLPTQKRVRAYSVGMRIDTNVAQPQSWYLQGSNDGINYETIDYQFDINNWALGETKLFYLTHYPKLYNNFRFYFLSVVGTTPTYAQMNELIFYEFEDDPNFTTVEKVFSPTFGSETTTITAVESFPLNMTSNVLPAPYVASSSNNYLTYLPYHAFDSSAVTGWQATENFVAGEWLKIDLGTPKSITSYTITSTNSFASKASSPLNFLLFGSNDNTAWTEVNFQIGVPWLPESEEVKTFQLSTPSAKFRYYRLEIVEVSEAVVEVTPDTKYPPPLIANSDQGYVVLASTTDATNFGWRAFDGSKLETSRWGALNASLPQWLFIQFPTAITLGKYVVTGSFTVCSPVDWTLEGSPDATNWVTLDTQSNIIWNADSEDKTFTLPVPLGPYKNFRITVTKSNILSQPVGIIELELWSLATVQVYKFGAMINNLRFNSLVQQGTLVDQAYPVNQTASSPYITASRVINAPEIPIMTSATAPAPWIVTGSSENASYPVWRAFNRSVAGTYDAWITAGSVPTGWVKIKYPNYACVNSYSITSRMDASAPGASPKNWTLEGSNNDSTWTVLDTRINISGWGVLDSKNFYFVNYNSYLYYRLTVTANNGHSDMGIAEINYGFNILTPTMSSNTVPAPYEVSYSSQYDGNYTGWKAFNKVNIGSYQTWLTVTGTVTGWIQIKLASSQKVNLYKVTTWSDSSQNNTAPKVWTFEGSNNGSTWVVLDSQTNQINWLVDEVRSFYLTIDTSYQYYRLNITANNGNASYTNVSELSLQYTYEPSQAFDSSNSTGWYPGPPFTVGDWLKIDLREPIFISKYKIKSEQKTDPPTAFPKDFVLEGSTDNVNWSSINSQTNVVWSGTLEEKTFTLPSNSAVYRYFRLVVNDVQAIITEEVFPPNQISDTSPNITTASRSQSLPNILPMTSNILPAPYIALASSEYNASYPAWKAFDYKNSDGLPWQSATTSSGWLRQYVGSPIPVNRYGITNGNFNDPPQSPRTWTFEGSNDGTAWTILDTRTNETAWTQNETRYYSFNNNLKFSYYRINVSANNGSPYLSIGTLQFFYGNYVLLNTKMTSNTAPTPWVADASSSYAGGVYDPWYAFDYLGKLYEGWLSNSGTTTGWLRLKFPTAVVVNCYIITARYYDNVSAGWRYPSTWTFEGSNDGSSWTVLDTRIDQTFYNGSTREFYFNNSSSFLYYRINITVSAGTTDAYVAIGELRLFNYSGNFPSWQAFDSFPTTGWWPGPPFTAGDWLKVELVNPSYVTKYKIKSEQLSDPLTGCPSDFILQGSNDNSAWTPLDTRTGVVWSGALEEKEFILSGNSATYKYFRLVINATSNGNPPYIVDLRFTKIDNLTKNPPYIADFRVIKTDYAGAVSKILPVSGYGVYDGSSPIRFSNSTLVPTMIGLTHPLGYEIKSSSDYNAASPSWRAFDGDATYPNSWYANSVAVPHWLQVKFPVKTRVKSFLIQPYYASDNDPNYKPGAFQLQGSNDGINFTTIQSYTHDWVVLAGPRVFTLTQLSEPYFYFRIYITTASATPNVILNEVLFYDFDIWSVVPGMTSNTVPAGYVASADSEYTTGTQAWIAFQDRYNTYFETASHTAPWWIQIKLPSPVTLLFYTLHNYTADGQYAPTNWDLRGSNDGVNWDIIQTYSQASWAVYSHKIFQVTNQKIPYSYFRIFAFTLSGLTYLLLKMWRLFAYDPTKFVKTTYPEIAFDNKRTSYHNDTSNFIKLKVPVPTAISKYSITPSNGDNLISWSLDGSLDDIAWSVLDSQVNYPPSNWAQGIANEFQIADSKGVWKYFRISVVATTSTPKFDISEIKMYHQVPYKAYYESSLDSLHSFSQGFDVKGWRNIPMLGPTNRVYLGADAYANNTFVSSRLEKTGAVTINEDYRFPWLIADDSYFNLPSDRQFPDWPIFWNGANYTFTPTNQTPLMTSDIEPVGYVASSGGLNSPGFEAFRAFDSLPDTYWAAPTAQVFSWIKLKLPTATIIRGVIIQANSLAGVGNPTSWVIEGSNNDVAWTALDSVVGQTTWALGERKFFLFPENTTAYLYYRMNITDATLGTSNHFGIAQIDYYSFPETSAPTVIEDQYLNKGTITGVIGVTSNPTYNDKSVLDMMAGAALKFERVAGFEITNFTLEVKMRLKKDITGPIFPLNSLPTYCVLVGYNYVGPGKWGLWLSSNGTTWNIADASVSTNASYPLIVGEWYHLRLSFDGAVYVFSINDVELIKFNSQTKIIIPTMLGIGRDAVHDEIGYVYDFRYLPFYEPPDKVFDLPFYSILRYDPITNIASKLLDINFQFRTGPSRWLPDTEFLVGEYNQNIYGAVTPITYAYGGITYLPVTTLQYPTGDPGFFQVNHVFGTHQFMNFLVVHPLAPIGAIIGKADKMPIDGVGYVSGAATWNGIRIPFLRYRNTIGIKWPQNDSADYLAIYTGNQAVGTVSGNELILSGIFRRNF